MIFCRYLEINGEVGLKSCLLSLSLIFSFFCPNRLPAKVYDSSDFYVYGIWRSGKRPFIDGNVGSVGAMYFEDMLRRDRVVLFTDFKWSRFDEKLEDSSFGVGLRYCIPCSSAIVGINSYFDYFESKYGNFRQAGVGLEFFSCKYDIRANAYFPTGKKCKRKFFVYDDYIGDYIVHATLREKALLGYDLEIGRRLCLPCGFSLYPAIGGYYFGSCCERSLGATARIALEFRDLVAIEGQVYYDRVNETTGEFRATVRLPLCRLRTLFCAPFCRDRTRELVRRRDYIFTDASCRYRTNY